MKVFDKSFFYAIITFIILNILYYLFFDGFYPCLIHEYTNLYCPGCGVTRMILSLVQLNFYQAFRYNALLFIYLILALIYVIIKVLAKVIFHKNIHLNNYVYIFLLVLCIGFGIIRNLPAFHYFIPTVVK